MTGGAFDRPFAGAGGGGTPALDFANTLDWRLRDPPEEQLGTYGELLRWARTEGILDAAGARELRAWEAEHPRLARRALAEAVATREAIADVFQALAHGRAVPAGPLGRLEAAARKAWEARTLRPERGGAAWAWRGVRPDRPELAAALDAARLLTSPECDRVRQCADAHCGWLFLDTSRNGSRRWCDMRACGNRNKARRWYRKRRAGAPGRA
jgi:predicted RNA-binding Zn ribbon-like protein